jgi:hypothetical protein
MSTLQLGPKSRVAPSGASLIIQAVDQDGNPAPITGVTGNSAQSVQVNAVKGTYKLGWSATGSWSAPIHVGAPASVVAAALIGVVPAGQTAALTSGDLAVSGFGPYTIIFQGQYSGVALPVLESQDVDLAGTLDAVPDVLGSGTSEVDITSPGFTLNGAAPANPPQGGWKHGGPSGGEYYCPYAGSGANYAQWQFTGLSAGRYVFAPYDYSPTQLASATAGNHLPAGFAPATARYRFYDGADLTTATFRGEVQHLQGQAQGFVTLGEVYCGSGTLTVVLADDADSNGGVVADAAELYVGSLSRPLVTGGSPTLPMLGVDGTEASDAALMLQVTAPGTPPTGDAFLFGWGTGQVYGGWWAVIQQADGKFAVATDGGRVVATAAATPGQSYVLYARYWGPAGAKGLWIDGVPQGDVGDPKALATPGAIALKDPAPMQFRSSWAGTQAWAGQVRRAAVWGGRQLSSTEITDLGSGSSGVSYAATATVNGGSLRTNLAAFWDQLDQNGLDSLAADTNDATANNLSTGIGLVSRPNFTSPSVTPSVVAPGGVPTVRVNGGSPVSLPAVPVWFPDGSQPYAVYPLPVKADPGDSVTVTVPDKAITSGSTPLTGVTGAAVTNLSGSVMPELPQSPPPGRTMRVGWNVLGGGPGDCGTMHSNAMRGSDPQPWGASTGPGANIDDGNGNPVRSLFDAYVLAHPGAVFRKQITGPANGYDPRRLPAFPAGVWTVMWDSSDGTGDMAIYNASPPTELTPIVAVSGQSVNNKRTYNIPLGQGVWFPYPYAEYRGGNVSNIRVYPPKLDGTAFDSPETAPKFSPVQVAKLKGTAAVRTMDWFGTNSSGVVDYADFPTQSKLSFAGGVGHPGGGQVVRLEAVTTGDGTPFAPPPDANSGSNKYIVKVTMSAPHNITDGCPVFGQSPDTLPGNTFAVAGGGNGGTIDLNMHVAYPVDATSFVWYSYTAAPITTTTVTLGHLTVGIGGGVSVPPEDPVDLCNQLGCDLWINVPHAATDACVTQLATLVAGRLNRGLKCVVELSNEHWNYAAGFTQFFHFANMGYYGVNVSYPGVALPEGRLSATQWYTLRTAQVHDLFATAFASQGRAADLVRTFGSAAVSTDVTATILSYAAGHDVAGRLVGSSGAGPRIPVDAVHIAPYMDLRPRGAFNGALPTALMDALTLEQHMDVGDAWFAIADRSTRGTYKAPRDHKAAIVASAYPGARLLGYEGGPGFMGLQGTQSLADLRSICWMYHPRAYDQMIQYYLDIQAGGVDLFEQFEFNGPLVNDGGAADYGPYWGYGIQPGSGAGNVALMTDSGGMAVFPNLEPSTGVYMNSVTGKAMLDWATAAPVRHNRLFQGRGRGRRGR